MASSLCSDLQATSGKKRNKKSYRGYLPRTEGLIRKQSIFIFTAQLICAENHKVICTPALSYPIDLRKIVGYLIYFSSQCIFYFIYIQLISRDSHTRISSKAYSYAVYFLPIPGSGVFDELSFYICRLSLVSDGYQSRQPPPPDLPESQ